MAPDWLIGLWRRERITLADGTIDRDTRVYWGQTRTLYVDIRIPKGRPRCRGHRSFAELTKFEIRRLASQQGFAGMARMAGRQCTWSREIDYQPDTGRPDTARLRIEGEVLSETGKASSAIGSDYEEIYVRERRGDELCAALRLAGSGRRPSAILVLLDDRFLFARARRVRLPVGPSLQDVVDEAEGDRARIQACLDCEIAMGRLSAPRPWTITLSTIPFHEGSRLFAAADLGTDSGPRFVTLRGSDGETGWRIIESTVPAAQLAAIFAR